MKSKLYKLVLDNRIIAEGSKREMQIKLRNLPFEHQHKGAFIGMGSPLPQLGQLWKQ